MNATAQASQLQRPGRTYLDHAATTPLDPRVLEAMLPYLTDVYGNPSSMHHEGREARKALDGARREVAEILGAAPGEVIFTSGGSESDALAIQGVVGSAGPRPHVLTSLIEHHAVLHTVQALERAGRIEAAYLPAGEDGTVAVAAVAATMRTDTALISVMYANNETGAVQPIAALSREARRHNPRIVFHTDAVQAAGWLPLDVDTLGVDLLTLTAHKFHGPRGTGVLYARTGVKLQPQMLGGSQERGRRAGTESVAGAVGLALALRLTTADRQETAVRVARLRDRLLAMLRHALPDLRLHGPVDAGGVLPGTLSCSIPGVEGEAMLQYLDLNGVAASSGAACTTGALEPSHVLMAMGVPEWEARNSLRLTIGRDTTAADIDRTAALITAFASRCRQVAAEAGSLGSKQLQ